MESVKRKIYDQKDVFKAHLLADVEPTGKWGIPLIPCCDEIPDRLVPFHQARTCKDTDQWVHFYEDDYQIDRIWNSPCANDTVLGKFKGVISPDFSIYANMPGAMQIWNTFRNHVLGAHYASNGIKVIPNVRWGESSSFDFCFDGLEQGKTIAIGTHGCVRKTVDQRIFRAGFYEMLRRLQPSCIIVYGSIPSYIEGECSRRNIRLVHFNSTFGTTHLQEV